MFIVSAFFQVEITVSKYPNRVLVYSVEGGCPMFFDVDGRGAEIYPTGDYISSAFECVSSFLNLVVCLR